MPNSAEYVLILRLSLESSVTVDVGGRISVKVTEEVKFWRGARAIKRKPTDCLVSDCLVSAFARKTLPMSDELAMLVEVAPAGVAVALRRVCKESEKFLTAPFRDIPFSRLTG